MVLIFQNCIFKKVAYLTERAGTLSLVYTMVRKQVSATTMCMALFISSHHVKLNPSQLLFTNNGQKMACHITLEVSAPGFGDSQSPHLHHNPLTTNQSFSSCPIKGVCSNLRGRAPLRKDMTPSQDSNCSGHCVGPKPTSSVTLSLSLV